MHYLLIILQYLFYNYIVSIGLIEVRLSMNENIEQTKYYLIPFGQFLRKEIQF